MKKLVLLCLMLIALAQNGLFAQEYVRPVHLDTVSKIFTFDDGKKYMLLDSMWMQTKEKGNGDLLWDITYLPLDKGYDGRKITDYKERDILENHHQALKTELKWVRTEDKYILSENLPEKVKDTVLCCSDSILLTVFGGDLIPFRIIINDTLLVGEFNKESNILSKDILGLENLEFDKNKKEVSVSRIQIVPKGHVSSFVKTVVFDYKENRCETYVPTVDENKGLNWIWIVATAVAALLIAAGILFFLKKRKKHTEDKLKEQIGLCFNRGCSLERAEEQIVSTFGRESKVKLDNEYVIKKVNEYYAKHKKDDLGKDGEKTLRKSQDEDARSNLSKQKSERETDKKEEKNREAVEKKIEEKQKEIDGLKAEIGKLSNDLQKAKQETKQCVSEARDEEQQRVKKKIDKLEEEKRDLEDNLDKERKNAKDRERRAREEEREKSEKTIADLNSKKDELDKQLSGTKKELKDTKASLDDYTERYNQDEKTIDRLKGEQKEYTDHISVVKFASDYSRDVNELLKIADKVVKAGESLTKLDVDDPYLIYKALGVFAIAQTSFDYQGLMVEAGMAAKCQMTFSDSGIANLKTVDSAHQIDSLRNHFLARYLESYINALVVCNESLAGIDRLVGGISKKDTAVFDRFRDEILSCCKRLHICVISVKLFDQIGENMDLKVRLVDYSSDIPSESIIAIDNCLVYPEGGNRPQDKIYVKAQK